MKLYHFTTLAGYLGILSSGSISLGSIIAKNGKSVLDKAVVSLTNSPNPITTGVPTGQEIPRDVLKKLTSRGAPYDNHVMLNGRTFQVDHTVIRISLDLPAAAYLQSAHDYYCGCESVLMSLAFAASSPLGIEHMSKTELDALQLALYPRYKSIVDEWWYYTESIPWANVVEVSGKYCDGSYVSIS